MSSQQLLYRNIGVGNANQQQNLLLVVRFNVQDSSLNHQQILLKTLHCSVGLVESVLNERLVKLTPSNANKFVRKIGCLVDVGCSNDILECSSKLGPTHVVVSLSFFCYCCELPRSGI